MSEEEVIKRSLKPQTRASLKEGLAEAGVKSGMVLLVHSSLSSIGWVCGKEAALILVLEDLLGPEGTLVMPAHSGDLSHPRLWSMPPVPRQWWPTIIETMPAFSKDLTPSRGMGKVAECFRKQKMVIRSNHPNYSFCARGKYAEYITRGHSLNFGLGMDSPLEKIYELGGYVLLIGTGHDSNTSLHLAEYRANYVSKKIIKCWAPVNQDGARVWKDFYDIDLECSDFNQIGKDYETHAGCRQTRIGQAKIRLLDQRSMVDFATEWMEQNRKQ